MKHAHVEKSALTPLFRKGGTSGIQLNHQSYLTPNNPDGFKKRKTRNSA